MLVRLVGLDAVTRVLVLDDPSHRRDVGELECGELGLHFRVPSRVETELVIEGTPLVVTRTELRPEVVDEIEKVLVGFALRSIERRMQRREVSVEPGFEDRQKEIVLALEVGVHGSLGESGDGSHLVERRTLESALGKHLGGRFDQRLTGLLPAALGGEGLDCHGLTYFAVYRILTSMSDDSGYRLPPPAEKDAAVLTDGLVRRYGSTTALRGVDIRVPIGEIYGFLGPNGAGKSTLIRILCTLVRPSAGQAFVAGHDVVTEPQEVRTRIGCALQEAALDDGQTGREPLSLQGRLYGLTRRDTRRRLDEVLDLVAIGEAIDRRIATYSGGMKRRVDLAAALVHDPEVLFLDEPTTGLDPDSRENVWNEVRRLNEDLGKTVFLTTQYLEEADVLANRIAIISGGQLVAEGSPTELKRTIGRDVIDAEVVRSDPAVLRRLDEMDLIDSVTIGDNRIVITTSDASAALSPVVLELSRAGLQVRNLGVRSSTLDDVFRETTRPSVEGPEVPTKVST